MTDPSTAPTNYTEIILSVVTLVTLILRMLSENKKTKALATKIDENTKISSDAFEVSNHVNEKLATVTDAARNSALESNDNVAKELARIAALAEETHRIVTGAPAAVVQEINRQMLGRNGR